MTYIVCTYLLLGNIKKFVSFLVPCKGTISQVILYCGIPTVSFQERVLKSKDNKYYMYILNSFRFYPRWRDWEMQQAMELDYTLDETQLAEDWASLLTLASQPGSSLEQLHIFVLAHVLRRPIIIYGVKYVKSWRGENLGYARFEGKKVLSNVLRFFFVNVSFK